MKAMVARLNRCAPGPRDVGAVGGADLDLVPRGVGEECRVVALGIRRAPATTRSRSRPGARWPGCWSMAFRFSILALRVGSAMGGIPIHRTLAPEAVAAAMKALTRLA